jgi:hypothetical protein
MIQDRILLFKIPTGTRKDFFEIYRQFGHAPSKDFTSPALGKVPHANFCYRLSRPQSYTAIGLYQ